MPSLQPVTGPALREWLAGKVAEAERALRIREDMAATWRTGTDAEWNAAASMHPSTAGRKSKRSARVKEADMHDRIAVKLRHDLAMFRAALAAISS